MTANDALVVKRRGPPRRMGRSDMARAARELFARQGFDETTVDEIAATIGIARRTLSRYFPSKNDIVWGDFDRVLARLRRHLSETPPDTH
jgi:AcrR family transcriptional regulator